MYQNSLETSMEEREFIFDSVQLMYYKCHKVNLDVVDHILILQTGWKRKLQE